MHYFPLRLGLGLERSPLPPVSCTSLVVPNCMAATGARSRRCSTSPESACTYDTPSPPHSPPHTMMYHHRLLVTPLGGERRIE
ncbi:hypothetical protein ElyMa_003634600 [Elysia marginata]|uniref:Secreted protein n=1 Tax=Elysia marginata TaxID=1093978 RepID=A0AAV4EU82_9GAST|nr:hypothetical protein ElyMa_003634600 [Elysia marginata]